MAMAYRWLLTLLILSVIYLPFVSGAEESEAQPASKATETKKEKAPERCKPNNIWNGTACVPGCEGWRYLEDGICTPSIRKFGRWFQFGVCILGIFASYILMPVEHVALRPYLLAAIGFAMVLNPTTWEVIGMSPSLTIQFVKVSIWASKEAAVVGFWAFVDFILLYLLIFLPSDIVELRQEGVGASSLAQLLAKAAFVGLGLWGRGVEFVQPILHIVPIYVLGRMFLPTCLAVLHDPNVPANVVQLRQQLTHMPHGVRAQYYALIISMVLFPVIRIGLHFLPTMATTAVLALEGIGLLFYGKNMLAYYRLSTGLGPVPPSAPSAPRSR